MATSQKVKEETKDYLNKLSKKQEVYATIALRIIKELEEENKELSKYDVSNSCRPSNVTILIKGLNDISAWDDEQKEWYDDPGHCANMTLIKYYDSKK